MTLFFVEHSDPMLRDYYLFTDEAEPNMYNSYLCFLVERKTLYLGEVRGESKIQVKSRYVKDLVTMDDFPAEEMWGDINMRKRFISTMKLILKNM